MPVIELTTIIHAPIERCFDLARSIDLHIRTTAHTGEKAIAGTTTGLISLGETVTWEATHFGIRQRLTSEITKFRRPELFSDKMIKGAFKSIEHKHLFRIENGKTILTDQFEYDVPFGFAGKLFDYFVLHTYMKKLLIHRNHQIKQAAESDDWKVYLAVNNNNYGK